MAEKRDSPRHPPIDYPDLHLLNAVRGWLELKCPSEARAELEQISRTPRTHPELLHVHWQLEISLKNWELALEIAEVIVDVEPDSPSGWIDRSYALHELKRTQEAHRQLLPAFEAFPDEPIIPYNLACYACQEGDLVTAKNWFEAALRRGDKTALIKMALGDGDLRPLWAQIQKMN
tara:strand:+ start:5317 stop:5844 length:528 start_codon:yes stop_codon:yes gene_type:complete